MNIIRCCDEIKLLEDIGDTGIAYRDGEFVVIYDGDCWTAVRGFRHCPWCGRYLRIDISISGKVL